MKKYIKNGLKGFVMGSADVVPGVSGGTMALILGIYEDLINSIRCINKKTLLLAFRFRYKEFFTEIPWQFLLSVGSGILLAVFTLARPLEYLLEHNPSLVWAFFFGLVAASIAFVQKRVGNKSYQTKAMALLGFIIAFLVAGLVPGQTPNTPVFIFLSGVIAICAMILPGISGSFLLVIMGKYEQILSAVNDKDFVTLVIFMFGAFIGIILFAKFISWLLHHYHDLTMAFLVGLMAGSLRKIWPWKVGESNVFPSEFNIEFFTLLLLVILGFSLVFVLEKISSRKNV